MARDFANTETQVAALEKRIKSIKNTALAGGLMAGAGVGILALFKEPIHAARQYELAFTKFKTLNLGDVVNKQADQFARSANLMGISSKELMTTMSESVGLFGSFDEAKKLAPMIASLNKANSAIFQGKIGGIDEGSTRSLMKFIDRRGGTKDDATFMRNLDLAQKMVTGSGGFVKFHDLDQFSQMGGTAFRGLSDQGILNMSLLLQEQGGAKAGTSLMSTYQNLVAGRTPKKTMAMLQEFGLGKLAMEEHRTVGGKSMKSLVMRDVKESGLLQSDPATWMRTVFLPSLAKKGITSEAGILKATNDLLSNRNASNQGSIMTTQLLQLVRDANLAKNAMGYNATLDAYKKDPNSKFADAQAKWENLMIALGEQVLPLAIKALEKLNPMLEHLANWMHDHSSTVKALAFEFVGLGVALVGLGSLALIAAGFNAISLAVTTLTGGAGVTLLGGALAGLAAPIAIAVAAIGTIALALYAFRPFSKKEIDNAGGVRTSLTPAAQERLKKSGDLSSMDNDFKPYATPPVSRKNNAAPVIHNHFHVDSKEVASVMISPRSLGPSGINPTAMPMLPGMNFGFGGNN